MNAPCENIAFAFKYLPIDRKKKSQTGYFHWENMAIHDTLFIYPRHPLYILKNLIWQYTKKVYNVMSTVFAFNFFDL